MFKIRDFSKLTRVSVKMLRHYDELGLLKPAQLDRLTGYRYYSAEQLPRLNRIIALKDLGFGLEQIGKLLDDQLPLAELRGMLRLRRAEIEQRLADELARLAQVEARLRHIAQSGEQPHYDVVIREVPSQLVASIRQTLVGDEGAAALFDELEAYAARHQARALSSPLAIYHDEDYHEEKTDIEVAVPLTHFTPSEGRVVARELLSTPTMACVVYTGGYERMDEALQALMLWIEANDYRIVGALREIYLRFHADSAEQFQLPKAFLTEQRELLVSEIQIPVEKILPMERGLAMSATRLSQIGQIAINIHDVKRAITFYRDTLGLKFLFEIPNAAFFDCGGVRLMLSMPEKPEFDHPASIIYYKVADLQATYELLSSRGVRFEDQPHLIARLDDHDLWMAFFRDPDNNRLALMSEAPRS